MRSFLERRCLYFILLRGLFILRCGLFSLRRGLLDSFDLRRDLHCRYNMLGLVRLTQKPPSERNSRREFAPEQASVRAADLAERDRGLWLSAFHDR
jgi:hypothetical protein